MKDHSWLLTKKRGDHRTDSRLIGIIAELVFAVFSILAGIVGLVWLCMFFVIPEWKIHQQFEKTVCTLVDCRVVPRTALDSKPITVEEEDSQSIFEDTGTEKDVETKNRLALNVQNLRKNLQEIYYLPEMQLKYRVNEAERTNWTSNFGGVARSSRFSSEESAWEFLKRWQKEEKYYCLYNPADPDQVVMMRDWQWENFLALVIPFSLLFIGIGIAVHALTVPRPGSKEKTALLTSSRTREVGRAPIGEFPYIPAVDDITDSPGIRLAYRLPMIDSPAWTLCVLALVTLAWWVGCVSCLTVVACSLLQTVADWIMLGYLLPFLAVGIWLLAHTLIQFRNETAVGPTLVEVENFPIYPGKPVRVFLSQGGELPLHWLNVVLVCEEEVVFTHGTNTRREKQRVYQRLIFGEERLDIAADRAFEVEFPLEIPSDAMHSFISSRNQINWRLLVQGKLERFPMFERSFPVIVYPAPTEGGR